MIKNNEIRLGNYLNYMILDSVRQGQVTTVTKNRLVIDGITSKYLCAEPIPLTEEWLINFGFEKVVYKDDKHGFGTEYHLRVNEYIFLNYSDDFSLNIYANKKAMEDEIGVLPKWEAVKYVNQLQNLYFALIGEELTLKKETV